MSTLGSYAGMSTYSGAMHFKSIASCLDLQNGFVVLNGERNNGEFTINCEVSLKLNELGVKMFPVPALSTTKVKFENTPPLTEEFVLSVWTIEGVKLSQRKESGYNLFQGVTLDVSQLQTGAYVLRIESPHYVDALKFVKGL